MIEKTTSLSWPKRVIIHTDGASRGNPGPASIGVHVLSSEDETIYEYGETLGIQTNNYAEYMAVLKALQLAVTHQVESLVLKSDSQLLIRQLIGQYKVKSETLRPIYEQCMQMARELPEVEFLHVRREDNRRADELANHVLDGKSLY